MKMNNIPTLGEKLNFFENNLTNTVKWFNIVFRGFPIDLPENTEVTIGDLVKCGTYKITTNTGEKFEHVFIREKFDESIIDDDFNEHDDF